MIEAEMYGMMPRAKTVTLARFPPENMSTRPNQLPFCCSKKSMRAWALMPGVGTWLPRRYTASRPRVKSTLFLRSGMSQMFRRLRSIALFLDYFGLAAHGRDLLLGAGAELVRADGDGLLQLAVAEHLEP